MEYQKIINLLDDAPNQPSKFGTRDWVKIKDESRWTYVDDDINNNSINNNNINNKNNIYNNNNNNNNIKFKASVIRTGLCDYSDAYILVKGTVTVSNALAQSAAVNNTNKKAIFKSCAPFVSCITEIKNTQVDNARDINIVMPIYNLK